MKTHPFLTAALAAIVLAVLPAKAATMSAGSTAPVVDDADIANLGDVSGTDKWFMDAARGQTITTGGAAVRLKSITYQVSEGNGAAATKTYTLRVGKVTGTNFTQVHSETATQNFAWTSGQYMTWTFSTPVLLDPYTTYGIDVGMTSSTSGWQTGIPYINVTTDDYAGGTSYTSGASGIGTSSISSAISSDRIFHLDMEAPLGPVFSLVAPTPADNATDAIASREIVMTFSQNVTQGGGNLTIRNLTDNIDTTIPANDSRLTYDQNVVRLNPAGLIAWNKNYAIRIDAGMFLGTGGAPVPAISDDTTWNFTTLANDPLLAAIAAIKAHVLNTTPLTLPQIAAHKTTIDNQRQRFAENTAIISAIFDLITTYDTAKGALFVSGSNVTSFSRNNTTTTSKNSVTPENYHWVIYTVMQHAMDVIYTSGNLAKYEATLNSYKFGSHASFPGPCSPPVNPLNTHTAQINGSFPATFGRHTQMWTVAARKPTGTYLAPGTIATVTVPNSLVNAGYKIRVGAHAWDLSGRPPVNRLERATRLYPIDSTTIKVASPYGGGIYIEVPYLASAGVVSVTVTGAVRSPYFSAKSFHATTPAQWDTEKTHAAPWADFQSDKFMTQVPRKWIYNMTGTQANQLMIDWDKSMDAINDLMGFDRNRGKETMYCQTDVILRSSVHAPGYPAVNVTSNVNSEVSPAGYAGNYLVRGPGNSLTAANIEFHEQGHAYFFPKFGGESESNVNLLQPAMLYRAFGKTIDEAQNGSFGGGNPFVTVDNTAIAWMTVFSFSPNEIPMQQLEKQYQHKGHAKWMDIARIYATPANPNAGWEKLDAYWRSFMLDDANNVPYGNGTDDYLLRLSRHVGKDIRPLFHFWGIHPSNPSALAAALAAENLNPDPAIKAKLLHYKSIVPANNTAFRAFAMSWWGRKPLISGAWEETDHAMQWDETLDADAGPAAASVRPTITTGSMYVEGCAAEIRARVDELVELYFPTGMTPATMSFTVAPTALNPTSVTMTAVTVTAASPPVQYYFENTTTNTNSGWISTPTWTQSGLTTDQSYSYKVKARDVFLTENNESPLSTVNLTAAGDITAPSPGPMTFAIAPAAVDEESITMTATTASDVNGVEYYFENITISTNSGWQDSPVYTEINLQPLTSYTYRVRARDKSPGQNATAFSANATASTADLPDETSPVLTGVSPADGSLVSNLGTNLVATFDEPIIAASGTITLKNLTDITEAVFNIGDPAVTITGNTLTLNPPANLLYGKDYAVQISSNAVSDLSNNPFAGIIDDSTWSFTAILADPIANPGGPYTVPLLGSLNLNGSASAPSYLQTISAYEWDLNNDGNYGDVTGVTPAAITEALLTSTWGMSVGLNTIGLRVTDSAAKTATATTTVKIGIILSWDVNGITAGFSTVVGAWNGTNAFWNDDITGGAGGFVTALTTNADDLNIAQATTNTGNITVSGTQNASSITFAPNVGPTATITGGAIVIGGSGKSSGIFQQSSGANTISTALTLNPANTAFNFSNSSTGLLTIGNATGGASATQTVTAASSNTGNINLAGIIANGSGGTVALNINSSGAGVTTLSGANSHSGGTTINDGTVKLGNATALGANTGAVSVASGAMLDLNGITMNGTNALTLNGSGSGGTGALINSSSSASGRYAGTVTLGSASTIGTTGTQFLQVSDGTNSVINLNGFLLTLKGNGTPAAAINIPRGNGITGAGGVTVDGAYLDLRTGGAQSTNNYSGTTTIQNGGGMLQNGGNFSANSNIVLNGGVIDGYFNSGFTRALGTGSTQIQITGGASGFGTNGSATINFGGAGVQVVWDSAFFSPSSLVLGTPGSSAGTTTFANAIDLSGATRTIAANSTVNAGAISGLISNSTGTAGLIKSGTGTLSLTNAANTYNGVTTINQGILNATTYAPGGSNSSIGSASVAATNIILNGGSLGHNAENVATTNRLFSVSTSGGGIDSSAPTATNTLSFTATTAMGFNSQLGTRTFTLGGSNTGNNTMAVLITDDGSGNATSLTKSGTGSWILGNAGNSYTGPTTLAGGSLLGNIPGGIATSGGISALIFNGGVLGLTGDFTRSLGSNTTMTDANFTGAGGWAAYGADRNVNLGGALAQIIWATPDTGFNARTLILGATSATHKVTLQNGLDLGTAIRTVQTDDGTGLVDGELSGIITGGAGGGLTKTGTGVLSLSNANTYSGVTTVSGGVLLLDNANALPGGIATAGGTSNLTFNGGVVGLTGDFTRNLNSAATVTATTFTGAGGWAAYGANRIVNLGGASTPITWATASTGFNNQTLILGAASATHTVDVQTPLVVTTMRTVQVENGSAMIDAKLSGNISGTGGGISKTGSGTLDIIGNMSQTGGLSVSGNGSTLNLSGTNIYSGTTTVGTGNPNATLVIQGSQSLSPNTTVNLVSNSTPAGTLKLLDDTAGTITLPNTLSQDSANATINFTVFVGNNNTANGGTSTGTTTGSTISLNKISAASLSNSKTIYGLKAEGANNYTLGINNVEIPAFLAATFTSATSWKWQLAANSAPISISGNVQQLAGSTSSTLLTQNLELIGSNTASTVSGSIRDSLDGAPRPLTVLKAGTGTWTFSGNNTYTGSTTINDGTLIGIGANAFGSTSGISIVGSKILSLRGDSNTNFVKASDSAPYTVSNTATGATINVDRVTGTGAATMTIGNLPTSSNSATWQLNFTGANGVGLNAGTLTTPTVAAASHTINNTIAGGGSLTLASVAGGGTGATATLIFTGTGNTIVSGAITQAATNQALTKNGAGTLLLNGANTHTGTTTISAGKLFINGSTGAGVVSVAADATLGGNGVIGGNTTIAATGKLEFDISTPAAGHNKLELANTKTLTFSGASVLTITSSGGAATGNYTLLTAPGGIVGNAPATLNLPSNWVATVSKVGNDLVLNVTSTGGGTTYANWASLNSAGANLGDDHDNDGVDNGTEYFMFGPTGNSTGFTALPGVINNLGTLSVTWTKAGTYTGTYGTHYVVETSDTLIGAWSPEASPVPVAISGNNVTYTFPNPLGTKKFARLKVTGP